MSEKLQHAAATLASMCDGAHSQDGQGYNKIDKDFGYWLASSDQRTWGNDTQCRAWRMLRKYRGQLKASGIEFYEIEVPEGADVPDSDDLPVPAEYVAHRRTQQQEARREREKHIDNMISLAAQDRQRKEESKPKVKSEIVATGDLLYFYSEYDAKIVQQIRNFPRRRFDNDSRPKRWIVNLVPENVPAVRKFIEEHPEFSLSDGILDRLDQIEGKAKSMIEASKASNADFDVVGLGGTLRPFQRAGVKYATEAKRVLIGDEMGLGKTVQGLATVHYLNAYPALIMCPASLKLNWRKEAKFWVPDKSVSVWDSKTGTVADVVVINYDNMVKRLEDLKKIGFKSMVADEAHYLKNGKAQRTKAVREIAKGIDVKIALTGTPVVNRPYELISVLQILDRLNDLGGYKSFIYRYCGAYHDRFGMNTSGATNLLELNTKLRQTCYIRREKSEVLKELPPKQRNVITVDLTNRRDYKRAEDDLIAYLRAEVAADKQFRAEIAHLPAERQQQEISRRQARAEAAAERAEHLVRIEKLKQLAVAGKLEAAKEWIENFLDTGESLLVFAHHQSVISQLSATFDAPSITGQTPVEERQRLVERFQAGEIKLLILNIRAGGVGLTLTKSSNTFFIELDWTPAAHDQAEDRVHRIGQESETVNAWYMLADESIDQTIYSLIEKKRGIARQVTDGVAVEAEASILNELIDSLVK